MVPQRVTICSTGVERYTLPYWLSSNVYSRRSEIYPQVISQCTQASCRVICSTVICGTITNFSIQNFLCVNTFSLFFKQLSRKRSHVRKNELSIKCVFLFSLPVARFCQCLVGYAGCAHRDEETSQCGACFVFA